MYDMYDKERPVLAIRLPADIEHRLESLAAATGRTKSFYARKAIVAFLEDMEDVYLAESRLADLRAGRSRRFTLEEVEKDLGLES
jgi:RHH-type rel operon transcriptional repressor/antitoxin RelB